MIRQLLLFPPDGEEEFSVNHVLLLLLLQWWPVTQGFLARVGISDAASCRPTLGATRRSASQLEECRYKFLRRWSAAAGPEAEEEINQWLLLLLLQGLTSFSCLPAPPRSSPPLHPLIGRKVVRIVVFPVIASTTFGASPSVSLMLLLLWLW